MYCPFCNNEETKVLESRVLDNSLRRRRECLKCSNRFTTYEKAVFNLTVLKKNRREEPFNLLKLAASIKKACGKADDEKVRLLAKRVENKILRRKANPIKTTDIGRYVLNELRKFDKIACLRFASIHKEIEDLKILANELKIIGGK
jgi:transcriptional repressor NrdR